MMGSPANDRAEIVAGIAPAWYALAIGDGRERATARRLAERGFGIYLPEFQEPANNASGRRVQRLVPMFPGYLFVFVWGFAEHWRRVVSTPGVLYPICSGGQPVAIPDRLIDQMQAAETAQRHGRPARRWRRSRQRRDASLVTISTRVDGESRNQVLIQALGLTSQAQVSVHDRWPEPAIRSAIADAAGVAA